MNEAITVLPTEQMFLEKVDGSNVQFQVAQQGRNLFTNTCQPIL